MFKYLVTHVGTVTSGNSNSVEILAKRTKDKDKDDVRKFSLELLLCFNTSSISKKQQERVNFNASLLYHFLISDD